MGRWDKDTLLKGEKKGDSKAIAQSRAKKNNGSAAGGGAALE
jgi:hypothetical protein